MYQREYQDIKVVYDNDTLFLSNRHFRRIIDFSQGLPKTQALEADGIHFAEAARSFDIRLAGFPLPGHPKYKAVYHVEDLSAEEILPPDGEGLKITVRIKEKYRQLQLEIHYYLYPVLPVLGVDFLVTSPVLPHIYFAPRQNDADYQQYNAQSGTLTIVDNLSLPNFSIDKSVEFRLRTDYHNDLVHEHPVTPDAPIVGNLLFASNASKNSLFFLQEAPLSNERRCNEPFDFLLDKQCTIHSIGSGINPEDYFPGRPLQSNRSICGLAANGQSNHLLKKYLLHRRPFSNRIACQITVNPWGCGNFPQRLNTKFLHQEIKAASQLHADVYQIDDGYEQGGLADMTVLNRPLTREFWTFRKDLLPDGFSPLVALSKNCGIALSLWFAPSANLGYENWKESAEILLDFHRRYGFNSFKLDGVQFYSHQAEENFGKLLQFISKESNGKITVNLDVTNGTRGGLFKFAEYGSIFLENRYCCHEWPACLYSPEQTLSHIWQLSQYCRIQNLQMEIPSPDDLLAKGYQDRNLALPSVYSTEYWAMVTLFASPLLWFAPSSLLPETAAAITKIMDLQRKYRNNWIHADISPVGNPPAGKAITGLLADSGWLLLFREIGAPAKSQLDLPPFHTAECIYSTAYAELSSTGLVHLASPGTTALFHLS